MSAEIGVDRAEPVGRQDSATETAVTSYYLALRTPRKLAWPADPQWHLCAGSSYHNQRYVPIEGKFEAIGRGRRGADT